MCIEVNIFRSKTRTYSIKKWRHFQLYYNLIAVGTSSEQLTMLWKQKDYVKGIFSDEKSFSLGKLNVPAYNWHNACEEKQVLLQRKEDELF